MGAIVVITATAFEQEVLVAELRDRVRQIVAGKVWHSGRLQGRPVRLLETGIGAVNTAHTLTCLLQAEDPDLVLQVGVGGAYLEAGLALGDLVLASREVYGDFGVRTREGWQGGELIGIPLLATDEPVYNHLALDPDLLRQAEKILQESGEKVAASGTFVTVQECSGSEELGRQRAALFGAICENMEGAAAAHICRLYQVPFVEVRSISNQVEDRRREEWDLPGAIARAQRAARHLVAGLAL
ncbi:MAG: futalosine hydrolase [Candidatus Latescibacteria bacterium]|nr:futalosine hydrolase [Candidatus Latescibacterota bacterium]